MPYSARPTPGAHKCTSRAATVLVQIRKHTTQLNSHLELMLHQLLRHDPVPLHNQVQDKAPAHRSHGRCCSCGRWGSRLLGASLFPSCVRFALLPLLSLLLCRRLRLRRQLPVHQSAPTQLPLMDKHLPAPGQDLCCPAPHDAHMQHHAHSRCAASARSSVTDGLLEVCDRETSAHLSVVPVAQRPSSSLNCGCACRWDCSWRSRHCPATSPSTVWLRSRRVRATCPEPKAAASAISPCRCQDH